ncbi:SGNH/GDSL hydrolase family protein [Streptomyces sp. NPDC090106]|uniref:SGNH/GDSL hydrolase family protein n=1 Tax=Streptomyces sp. NPDC090106 TaxID=3365946 RepID=UPI00380ADEAA
MTAHAYLRYVALGDSQTEGLGDGDDVRGLRGWADRLAERAAASSPELSYANLAVRGRLAGAIRAEQLAPALALKPDLATVCAGMNDLLRPRVDLDEVAGHLEAMFAALTGAGARVATLTFPDVARLIPMARPLAPRAVALNDRIREAAARHGVVVAETSGYAFATDPRLWSTDRLHASTFGHTWIATMVADALGLPDDGRRPEPPPAAVREGSALRSVGTELRWAGTFLGPWLVRRVRGRSSGDGRRAKRPELLPVRAPSADQPRC